MITKALLPVAGFGSRMLPAAKAVPKELLPVLDKPTVQYVVQECADAGLGDILLVTSRDKPAIEHHFDRYAELEDRLAAGGKQHLLASVAALMEKVTVHAVRQREQLGLGHAVLQGRQHVGDQTFLCALGDTIFSGEPSPAKQLIEAHEKLGGTVIGMEEVPAEKVSRYGILGGDELSPGVLKVTTMVEKPTPQDAPSRYAVAARYVLSPAIFDILQSQPPGAGGEIQLTDALKTLIQHEPVHGVALKAKRHDIGNPVDWLKTNLIYAKADAKLWKEIEPMLRALMS